MGSYTEVIDAIKTIMGDTANPVVTFIANSILIVILVLLLIVFVMDFLTKFSNLGQSLGKKSKFFSIFKTKRSKRDDIKTRVKFDNKMQQILKYCVKKYNLSRAMLFQFHNGMNAKSGMPFEYVVLTHEATANGAANSNLSSKHHDIRIFYELISTIIDNKVYRINSDNAIEPLKTMMDNDGTTSLCAHIVTDLCEYNLRDNAIGFLIFTSFHNTMLDETKMPDDDIIEIAHRCSGLLSTSYGNCEFCKNAKTCRHIKDAEDTMKLCEDYEPTI